MVLHEQCKKEKYRLKCQHPDWPSKILLQYYSGVDHFLVCCGVNSPITGLDPDFSGSYLENSWMVSLW